MQTMTASEAGARGDQVTDALYIRMFVALRSHCPRTARARIRDIVRRRTEINGEDPQEVYCEILERINQEYITILNRLDEKEQ